MTQSAAARWAIVGAGPQGLMAAMTLRRAGVELSEIAIIDPRPPLAHFRSLLDAGQIRYMNTPPRGFHLDAAEDGLEQFLAKGSREREISPWGRPARKLWMDHAEAVVQGAEVAERRIAAKVVDVCAFNGGYELEFADSAVSRLYARNVIVATGLGERRPLWPDWSLGLESRVPLHHAFDADFRLAKLPGGGELCVIGGGLIACRIGTEAAASGRFSRVIILSLHDVRERDEIFPLRWLDRRFLDAFEAVEDPEERERLLIADREFATILPETAVPMAEQLRSGNLIYRIGAVRSVCDLGDRLQLSLNAGRMLTVSAVVLATAYQPWSRNSLLGRVAERFDLPISRHGGAALSADFSWQRPGLFVMGEPAALTLGLHAAGTLGARWAAARIAKHV